MRRVFKLKEPITSTQFGVTRTFHWAYKFNDDATPTYAETWQGAIDEALS